GGGRRSGGGEGASAAEAAAQGAQGGRRIRWRDAVPGQREVAGHRPALADGDAEAARAEELVEHALGDLGGGPARLARACAALARGGAAGLGGKAEGGR